MLITLIPKLAVIAAIGASAGFSAFAATVPSPSAPGVQTGAFGGPVSHVGTIERDIGAHTANTLRRVACIGGAPGTSCFVAR
jgi:hypothetical protein